MDLLNTCLCMSYPVTEYWGGCHLVDFQQAADEKKEEVENLLEEERGSGSGSGGGESVTKGDNFQKSERAQVRSVRALVVRGPWRKSWRPREKQPKRTKKERANCERAPEFTKVPNERSCLSNDRP